MKHLRKPGDRMSETYKVRHPVRQIPTKEQFAHQYTRSGNQSKQHIFRSKKHTSSGRTLLRISPRRNAVYHSDYEIEEDENIMQLDFPQARDVTRSIKFPGASVSERQTRYTSGMLISRSAIADKHNYHPPDERDIPMKEKQHYRKPNNASIHPMLYLGVGMLAMAALFLLLSSAGTGYRPQKTISPMADPEHSNRCGCRTQRLTSKPSHFIAMNLYRHVQVIEIPGQDATKERTFQITTLFGDGEDLHP